MKVTFWRYRILSKITFGAARERYKRKKSDLRSHIKAIEGTYDRGKENYRSWLTAPEWRREMIMQPPTDGLNRSKREREIIVSLTTFPARIETVWIVLKQMMSQTCKPDRVLLYLAEEQFPGRRLPDWADNYRAAGVEFIFCDDLMPHKKYFYVMREYPEAVVITVDDDLYYDTDLVEKLYNSYLRFPRAVSSLRTHEITFGKDGHMLPYTEWNRHCSDYIGQPLMRLLSTCGAGALFPPNSLHPQVFNEKNIRKTCLRADDLWLKVMSVLQGTPVVLAEKQKELSYIEGTQDEALWKTNLNERENDNQLRLILERYNEFLGKDDTVEKRIMSG